MRIPKALLASDANFLKLRQSSLQTVMPKKIMPVQGYKLYVAHQMLGEYDGHNAIAIDEKSKRRFNPGLLDNKILIYQRQVEGWFLAPAREIYTSIKEQASFVILSICFAYLEGVQQYIDGKSSKDASKTFFRDSFNRTFGSCGLTSTQIYGLYDQGRCGLFHDGMTRTQVIYDMSLGQAFAVRHNGSQDLFHFHPAHVLQSVEKDFADCIAILNDPNNNEYRKRFDSMFSVV